MKPTFFIASNEYEQLSRDIDDLHKINNQAPSFHILDHYCSTSTQQQVRSIMQRYNDLLNSTGRNTADLAKVRSMVVGLLHTETLSAVKIYQLLNVGEQAHALGAATEEEHRNQQWQWPDTL
jgi:hypothetical protein